MLLLIGLAWCAYPLVVTALDWSLETRGERVAAQVTETWGGSFKGGKARHEYRLTYTVDGAEYDSWQSLPGKPLIGDTVPLRVSPWWPSYARVEGRRGAHEPLELILMGLTGIALSAFAWRALRRPPQRQPAS